MLYRIGSILFSVLYWPASFTWMLVGFVATIVLRLVGVPYQRVHMWATAPIFGGCVPLSMTRMKVHVHPDFDPEVRSVFAQNHINLIDGHVASRVIPHAFSGLMHAWQFKIPIYGQLMSLAKGIPVVRGRRDETLLQISEAARNRKEIGMSVLVFPEGHRTTDGTIRNFRRGVFLMARNAGMPIVPITVRGLYEVNRKGSMVFHPGRKIDVFVGPQFSTEGLSDSELGAFVKEVRAHMLHCFEHNRWPEQAATPEAAPIPAASTV
ncbi:MAG: 1-acyl-sn-glycerol-3-phosphate acyltransferase [Deltaproteobacteria bacterium]|nr:1-acyl-sn-glycerol-3-phosphate acyltransferase [Deltaproteobacteria bacterium]